jgi:hypothetical protein
MCTTSDGYTTRTISTTDAVKLLSQSDAWRDIGGDEWEDSRDIIEIMRSVCKSRRSKRKERG